MSTELQPIKVWGHGGPNPPKVAILLEELGVHYKTVPISLADVKKPDYLLINPNGRIPAIYDPNTDITLWESGAILEYVIERYDPDHRFSFPPGTPEAYHAKQWLFFQVSGQGPYYGQAAWFKKFHHEQLPSALERYNKEVNRVTGVLEGWLAEQKRKFGDGTESSGPWLVGNKLSYVDLAFISWQRIITMVLEKSDFDQDNFPLVKEWLDKLTARPTVKAVLEETVAAVEAEKKRG
jgi:glutathione S-transferase